MADTGATAPTSAASIAGPGNTWSSPSNVFVNDGALASVDTAAAASEFLATTFYGFEIPADASIDGVEVTIEYETSIAGGAVYLTKNGSSIAGSGEWLPASSALTTTYGGATSLWGTTFTATEVMADTFGVLIYMENDLA